MINNLDSRKRPRTRPLGLVWRSSYQFTTFIVGLGIAVDLLVYSIIIPVMPFHLEQLGFKGVSSLTGWLLFAYSAGLVISTIPIAMLSERYNSRRWPLIIGLVILLGSQVLLMEAPIYAVLCIARILQGVGSSMVWVVGLALLCDSSPERCVGRQLGMAMSGLSIGLVIGPPVGGALYGRFGYRGPFIFSMIVTLLDLIGRILVIERKDAILWGQDPTKISSDGAPHSETEPVLAEQNDEKPQESHRPTNANIKGPGPSDEQTTTENGKTSHKLVNPSNEHANPPEEQTDEPVDSRIQSADLTSPLSCARQKPLSLLGVVIELAKSSRALVAFIITFVYGVVYSSQEPTIPLHLQRVWGLDPRSVGLVFIAAVVPTLISSPLTGYYADQKGTEWVMVVSLALALPWWVIVIIQRQLVLFIVAFAVETFFTSGVISPLMAELAGVSRGIKGVGYAHVYGAFNLAYGLGTSVGPIVGGQMYDRLKGGWTALCLLATGLLAVCVILAFCFTGEDPLFSRVRRHIDTRRLSSRHEAESGDC